MRIRQGVICRNIKKTHSLLLSRKVFPRLGPVSITSKAPWYFRTANAYVNYSLTKLRLSSCNLGGVRKFVFLRFQKWRKT